MLTANKSVWFEKLFGLYNRSLLKRRFSSFRVQNLPALKTADKSIPLIIYANHSSWWDGLILFELLKSKEFDLFVLMEEKQLKEYKLFRRLGAFSIVRENPRDAVKSLNYAVEILKAGKNKTLLIFPQGEILPNDSRPLTFFNGLAFLTEKLKTCTLLPGSIRFEFLDNFKPEIFVSFGKAELFNKSNFSDRRNMTKHLEEQLTVNLDSLKSAIIEKKFDDFQKIF